LAVFRILPLGQQSKKKLMLGHPLMPKYFSSVRNIMKEITIKLPGIGNNIIWLWE
jgi:hypothetical protein